MHVGTTAVHDCRQIATLNIVQYILNRLYRIRHQRLYSTYKAEWIDTQAVLFPIKVQGLVNDIVWLESLRRNKFTQCANGTSRRFSAGTKVCEKVNKQ